MREKATAEEIETRGHARYLELREQLETDHFGQIVVIDIYSGDYEVALDDLTATLRMFARRPDALTWGERIGGGGVYVVNERISFVLGN